MFELLDSLRPHLGILSGASIVIVFISFGWVSFNNIRFKLNKTGPSANQGLLDESTKKMFLKNLTEVYRTSNIKTVMSTVTENLYYSIEAELSILTKLGLRKEVTIIPVESPVKGEPLPFVIDDGKNNMTLSGLDCSYTEKYIDNATGKVLYKKKIPHSLYTIELIKSDILDLKNEYFCSSCGAPMEVNGDFFDCHYCSAHYNTESYSWSASDVIVQNRKNNNSTSNLFIGFIFMFIAVTLLGLNFPYSILGTISISLDIFLILFSVLCALVVNHQLRYIRKILAADKNFSRSNFKKRVVYLLKRFYLAQGTHSSLIQPLMVSELYKELESVHKYDNYYLLDFDVLALSIKDYYVKNGKQVVSVDIKANTISMNPKKKLRKKKQKIRINVCRDEKTFTNTYDEMKTVNCENCNAPINLAKDGKCKYCGNTFDLSKFDWIIYKI